MGYNATIFICTDALSDIKKNAQEFVDQISVGINRATLNKPYEFGVGCHANGMSVIHCQHADVTTIIAAGGNYATPLAHVFTGHSRAHTSQEDQTYLLKELADKLGYRIVKKAARKVKA